MQALTRSCSALATHDEVVVRIVKVGDHWVPRWAIDTLESDTQVLSMLLHLLSDQTMEKMGVKPPDAHDATRPMIRKHVSGRCSFHTRSIGTGGRASLNARRALSFSGSLD